MSVSEYSEAGMVLRPINPSGFFHRVWPEGPFRPYSDTVFIRARREGDSEIMFSVDSGLPFNLLAVDLGEYGSDTNPSLVPFDGYRSDGSVVQTSFLTDGINKGEPGDFETFSFGPEFSNLTRVEIPEVRWSMDNLVFTVVPEPSPAVLMVVGGALLLAGNRRRATRRQTGKRTSS